MVTDERVCRALRLHPDKGGDPELFKEVTHAYVSAV
jgi:curved DNA-binding protein CbpA